MTGHGALGITHEALTGRCALPDVQGPLVLLLKRARRRAIFFEGERGREKTGSTVSSDGVMNTASTALSWWRFLRRRSTLLGGLCNRMRLQRLTRGLGRGACGMRVCRARAAGVGAGRVVCGPMGPFAPPSDSMRNPLALLHLRARVCGMHLF